MVGEQVLVVGLLLAGGVAASLLAVRLRVPSLLLFLAIGLLIGSDVAGWVPFDDYELAQRLSVIALALILFDGGLRCGWSEIRPMLGVSLSLAVVGTVVTAVITGVVAAPLLGLSVPQGLLLGAVLSSTDGAAIFALLRGSQLRRDLARTLEGESGFNDPVAVLLVVVLIKLITEPATGLEDVMVLLIRQLSIGVAVGLAVGWVAIVGLRSLRLASAGLYPVATLATAAVSFGAAASLEGSGFLSVYLTGLILGDGAIPARRTVGAFHDGVAWVAQVGLFVMLGLLVFPSRLAAVALDGTVVALVLALVARPIATALSTMFFRFSLAETVVVGWAGLRGAVPVVLATFVVVGDVPGADGVFNVVFFAVIVSTLLQGTTVETLAGRLGLTTREPALPAPLSESGTIRRLGAQIVEFPVGDQDAVVGVRVRDLALPREAVVSVIVRGSAAVPPRGSTVVHGGDELHVLVRDEVEREVHDLLTRWRTGPIGRTPRARKPVSSGSPVFSAWPWSVADGDPSRPQAVRGHDVIERLRVRRDAPGSLVVLDDGRYAVTGPRAAIGSRVALTAWAHRRLRHAHDDERPWLETVIAALAGDLAQQQAVHRSNRHAQ